VEERAKKAAGVPCVGVSFGIERLFAIMEMKNKALQTGLNLRVSPTDVYVASIRQSGSATNMLKKRMWLCSLLWNAGIRAELSYKANPKLMDQIQFCERNIVPLMVLFGEDELSKNCVKIRNVPTREEKIVVIDQLIEKINEELGRQFGVNK